MDEPKVSQADADAIANAEKVQELINLPGWALIEDGVNRIYAAQQDILNNDDSNDLNKINLARGHKRGIAELHLEVQNILHRGKLARENIEAQKEREKEKKDKGVR